VEIDIDVRLGERVLMPDGVELGTDIYRPRVPGDYPVVLIRPPYDTRSLFHVTLARHLVLNGFVAVVQAVRGTTISTGTYELPEQECRDTGPVLRWLAGQPWFSGRLCPLGISYSSFCAFVAAEEALRLGIEVPCVINLLGGLELDARVGGALRLHWALPLCVIFGHRSGAAALRRKLQAEPDLFERPDLGGIDLGNEVSNRLWHYWLSETPLPEHDVGLLRRVPVLTFSGWWDFMVDVAFATYRSLEPKARAERHALIVGPWDHHAAFREMTQAITGAGAVAAAGPAPSIPAAILAWLREHAAGGERVILPGVYYQVDGEADYRYTPAWGNHRSLPFYLSGPCDAPAGRRRLGPRPPENPERVTFDHDPRRPVPTIGGRIWPLGKQQAGPADQGSLEAREDIVIYETEPLNEPLRAAGEVRLNLRLRVAPVPADIAVKLVDVRADGCAAIVADSIARLRDEVPGERRLDFRVADVAHTFGAGHRVRLEVSGSNFPKFDRAAGPGPGELRAATYTLTEGGADPACLLLPLRP